MNTPIPRPPLYLITDRHQTKDRPLLPVIREALSGGVRFIQLREKDLPTRDLLALAQEMRRLTLEANASLLINNRIDICLAVEADGVHLPSNGLPVRIARRILGVSKLLGASAHSLEEAQQAQEEGADFITLGPIYKTPSKARYGPPLGLDFLKTVRRTLRIPLLALGGIHREQIGEVLQAGADGVALISAVLSAKDPRQAALDLIHALQMKNRKS